VNEFVDSITNPSPKTLVSDLKNPLRRRLLIGSAVAALFNANPVIASTNRPRTGFSFQSVSIARAADNIVVPEGYRWSVVAAWGDPIDGVGKGLAPDASNSAHEQEQQFGMHHDGCAFFPEKGQDSTKGLWVVNHEYTDDGMLHPGGMTPWTAEKVRKSQAAHGVTVSMIARQSDGSWRPIPSPVTRRITASTPCDVGGPAAGNDLMKTAADPSGKSVLGTLNNCAHGVTPWGTYLTCEENFNGYFVKTGSPSQEERRVGIDSKGFGYRWHEFDERFDANKHPNEPNRFGWVVEIDPHDASR
jgi:uncharacterized protein